ncbi:hypothetical protein GCM10023238_06740 [Streptomyces heliomycini]
MSVLAHDPYVPDDAVTAADAEPVALDALLARADVVTLHLPPAGAPLLDAARLAAMKPGAILVNAARGGLVDDTALAAALHSGHLAAAALDAFAVEPLPAGHVLRTAPRLTLTSHMAACTPEANRAMGLMVAEDVLRVLAGDPPRHAAGLTPPPTPPRHPPCLYPTCLPSAPATAPETAKEHRHVDHRHAPAAEHAQADPYALRPEDARPAPTAFRDGSATSPRLRAVGRRRRLRRADHHHRARRQAGFALLWLVIVSTAVKVWSRWNWPVDHPQRTHRAGGLPRGRPRIAG